eukprot:scaffold225700_cov21-Tisochrysis_lutea.AAC.2
MKYVRRRYKCHYKFHCNSGPLLAGHERPDICCNNSWERKTSTLKRKNSASSVEPEALECSNVMGSDRAELLVQEKQHENGTNPQKYKQNE